MSHSVSDTPEFSRLIAAEGIAPDKTRHETISATAEECVHLAERLDLRSLTGLTAEMDIRRVSGGNAVRINGRFVADVVQACVVSLQDVPDHIEASFETFFTTEQGKTSKEIEFVFNDDENTPEQIVNGMIDLGEIVTQYLSLELNPYPRAAGADLAIQLAEAGVGGKANPFQVLENLKNKKD